MLSTEQVPYTVSEIADYFGKDRSSIARSIKRGNRLDLVYVVLQQPESVMTDKDKWNYLRGVRLAEHFKRKCWDAYLKQKGEIQC